MSQLVNMSRAWRRVALWLVGGVIATLLVIILLLLFGNCCQPATLLDTLASNDELVLFQARDEIGQRLSNACPGLDDQVGGLVFRDVSRSPILQQPRYVSGIVVGRKREDAHGQFFGAESAWGGVVVIGAPSDPNAKSFARAKGVVTMSCSLDVPARMRDASRRG